MTWNKLYFGYLKTILIMLRNYFVLARYVMFVEGDIFFLLCYSIQRVHFKITELISLQTP